MRKEHRALNAVIESCLISLLVFTPLALGTVQPWSVFIMRAVVVVALLAWLVKIFWPAQLSNQPTDRPANTEIRILDIVILAFLAVAGVSTLFISSYRHLSLQWFTNLTVYAAVYFIVANNIKRGSQVKRLIGAMLTAGAIAGVYGILRYFNILDILPHSTDPRISSTYYHPSHYAGFLVMTTPLAISYFLFSKSFWKNLAFGILSVLLIANLALSFSITNLAFVISMILLIIVILSLREWQVIVKKLVPVGAAFFLVYLLALVTTSPKLTQYALPVRFGQIANVLISAINGRIHIWQSGLPVALSKFHSGWGLGLFSDVFSIFRPATRRNFLNYAHSDYLQIFSDMGIVGLGVWLVLVGSVTKKGIHLLGRRFNLAITIGVTVALFAAIVRSLWDNNLFIVQSLSVYFFLLIGLMVSLMKITSTKIQKGLRI